MPWKTKRNDFPLIRERLPQLMDETTAWAAQEIANSANGAAPSAANGAPFSSGALSVSYYAAGAHSNGYAQALTDAAAAAGSAGNDLLDDGAVAPKRTVARTAGTARAIATSCLNYAYAVEHGFFLGRPGFWFGGKFFPVKSPGHMVAARPHFFPAVDKAASRFFKQLARDLKSLETVRVPQKRLSAQEREHRDAGRARERAERDFRRGRSAFNREQRQITNDLLNGADLHRTVNATRTTKTGKRFRETFAERAQRLRDHAEQARFDQNNRQGGF